MNERIEQLVVELSHNPFDAKKNFEVALEYEKLNQSASAIGFYLRCIEYSTKEKDPFVYTSLLKLSLCFESQKDRIHTVSNSILQAISYNPTRPEGYFLMSRFHERLGNWQECYTWADLGLRCKEGTDLPTNVDYFGRYCLEFEKAISAWWVGRKDEAQNLLVKLSGMDMRIEYVNAVRENLKRVGVVVI